MTTVLQTEIRVLPEHEKHNLVIPFTLPEAVQSMTITFSYAPKTLDGGEQARQKIEACLLHAAGETRAQYPDWTHYLPLKNLITLSLDAPDGYRGCAHRQAQQQTHVLTETTASPGFLPGALSKGAWQIVLNVHALVTDFCDCSLRIQTEAEAYA